MLECNNNIIARSAQKVKCPTNQSLKKSMGARFGSTYTKIRMIQRRLAWHLRKDDMQKEHGGEWWEVSADNCN